MSSDTTSPLAAPNWLHHHALSPDDAERMRSLREQVASGKGLLRGIEARPAFEAINEHVVGALGFTFHEDVIGGVPGIWCTPEDARDGATLVHLHGGWFTWGSASGFRNLVSQLAAHSAMRAFIPDYRLAPEHPFPAAMDDALAVVRTLTEKGVGQLALSGDSAGGNLALLLAARSDLAFDAVVALSPITDLTLSGASWETKAEADPYFTRPQAQSLIEGYLAGHSPTDPAASPLFADLSHLSPVQVHVGSEEVLLDDSIGVTERANEAGRHVELHIWEGMPHSVPSGATVFDASDASLQVIGRYLNAGCETNAGRTA